MSKQMKNLYSRISEILGRDCPAIGGVSGEAIAVIREMEDRLETAYQLLLDIDDAFARGAKAAQIAKYIEAAMSATDVVADFESKGQDND